MGHEHAHADPNDPFQRRVAISMAIYAVLLAFMTMLTNQARTEGLHKAADRNDTWAHYQAKSTKQVVVKAEADLIAVLAPEPAATAAPAGEKAPLAHPSPAMKDKGKAAPKATEAPKETEAPKAETPKSEGKVRTAAGVREKMEAEAERYEKDKEDLMKEANEISKEGEHEKHKEHWFEYASTAIELAIIVATVGLLLNSKSTFFGSIALAGAAVVLAIVTAVT